MEKLKIPETGETAVVHQDDDTIVFLQVSADPCPINPCEDWDGFGKFYSFNTRHVNYCATADIPAYKVHAVALSYFEYGICIWGVQGSLDGIPDFCWDGVHCAGVWVPDKTIVDEIPADSDAQATHEFMKARATQACKTYTHWCNGEVYDYTIAGYQIIKGQTGVVTVRDAYEQAGECLFEESCGGYYGYDHDESGLAEAVQAAFEHGISKIMKLEAGS